MTLRIGMVGAGFVANIHARAYSRLREANARVVALADPDAERAQAFARQHDIPEIFPDIEALLKLPDIHVIDLCVPNKLHAPLAILAAESGKHVFCEKPLTGYFGGGGATAPVGHTPKVVMRGEAVRSAEAMVEAAERNGVKLMYGENWLYSPPIRRTLDLVLASGGTILEMRAQECHSGSHAAYAKQWQHAGGGALLRLGVHPLGGALFFKAQEGLARNGRPIRLRSVVAETADLATVLADRPEHQSWFVPNWQDVETWATVIMGFEDGTRATIFSSDYCLGGMEDTIEVFASNCRVVCDFEHSTMIKAYSPTPAAFENVYIAEKLETKAGWSYPAVDEEWALGYPQEIQDFVEAVIEDREAVSNGRFGLEVVKAVYAAYQSAEEGRRIAI